jgi:hypothetical protein
MMAFIVSTWLFLTPCPFHEWPYIDPPMVEEFIGIKKRTKNSKKQMKRSKKKAKRSGK